MEAVARRRGIPMSARKMRLVVDLIRGKQVDEALDVLRYTKKEAAEWCEKLLLSAIANWEHKLNQMEDADDYDLIIKTAFADDGAMLKRIQPAPRGMAHRIRKRTCHVTLVVENRVPLDDDVLAEAHGVQHAEEEE